MTMVLPTDTPEGRAVVRELVHLRSDNLEYQSHEQTATTDGISSHTDTTKLKSTGDLEIQTPRIRTNTNKMNNNTIKPETILHITAWMKEQEEINKALLDEIKSIHSFIATIKPSSTTPSREWHREHRKVLFKMTSATTNPTAANAVSLVLLTNLMK
jgi:hypothetical protein